MARYIAQIRTPRPADEVFGYLADMRNAPEWDPSIRRVVQVEGSGGGVDAVFDVTVGGVRGGETTFRYRTTSFDPPKALALHAESQALTSYDRVRVTDEGDRTVVVYEADLQLNGWRRVADPLLARMFRRYGEPAADGLVRVLDGERIA
jgi:hypothetical protein